MGVPLLSRYLSRVLLQVKLSILQLCSKRIVTSESRCFAIHVEKKKKKGGGGGARVGGPLLSRFLSRMLLQVNNSLVGGLARGELNIVTRRSRFFEIHVSIKKTKRRRRARGWGCLSSLVICRASF